MNLQRVVGLVVLLTGWGAAGAASDAPPSTLPAAPRPAVVALATPSISMDEAVKMAEQHFRARVLKATTEQDNGHTVYVLRLLNDAGRVWTVRMDATSGAFL